MAVEPLLQTTNPKVSSKVVEAEIVLTFWPTEPLTSKVDLGSVVPIPTWALIEKLKRKIGNKNTKEAFLKFVENTCIVVGINI